MCTKKFNDIDEGLAEQYESRFAADFSSSETFLYKHRIIRDKMTSIMFKVMGPCRFFFVDIFNVYSSLLLLLFIEFRTVYSRCDVTLYISPLFKDGQSSTNLTLKYPKKRRFNIQRI